MPNLKALVFSQFGDSQLKPLTDVGMQAVARYCVRLQLVDLTGQVHVSIRGVLAVARANSTTLRELDIGGTGCDGCSAAELAQLPEACPALSYLCYETRDHGSSQTEESIRLAPLLLQYSHVFVMKSCGGALPLPATASAEVRERREATMELMKRVDARMAYTDPSVIRFSMCEWDQL